MTIVVVTHDVEFAAECADRCALFFRGEITSCATPRRFFSENSFYTTAVNRMTRGHFSGAVTLDDAVRLCRQSYIPATAQPQAAERPAPVSKAAREESRPAGDAAGRQSTGCGRACGKRRLERLSAWRAG